MLSLSLTSRSLPLRSLFNYARHFTVATLPTRRDMDAVNSPQATSDNSLHQITDILDDAVLSTSPQSNKFIGESLVASASQLSSLCAPGT